MGVSSPRGFNRAYSMTEKPYDETLDPRTDRPVFPAAVLTTDAPHVPEVPAPRATIPAMERPDPERHEMQQEAKRDSNAPAGYGKGGLDSAVLHKTNGTGSKRKASR